MTMLEKITPVILTYNEAPNIARTLTQLQWARRVVVVDSGSDDETVQICRTFANVTVMTRAFDSHAAQWNWALANGEIDSDWVLALDADYRLSDAFVEEVRALEPATSGVVAYSAPFRYCLSGRALRASLYPSVVVLFRRDCGSYYQDGHTQRLRVNGRTGAIAAHIFHDDRKSLQRWLTSQDRYATLESEHLLSAPVANLSVQDKIRRGYFFAPFIVPVYCLVVKGLIFDGLPGWMYAFQRGIAEAILAIKLLERRIGISA